MVQLPPGGAFLDPQRIVSALGVIGGMQVADLGSGSGFNTIAMARAVGKDGVVSAVDVMQEALQSVQTKAEGAGLANVRLVHADLEVLGGTKIPDNSQDISLVATVLFQSQKKKEILAEGARILKPGGRIAIIDWKKGMAGYGPPDELRTDEQTLRSLAEAVGLTFERTVDVGAFYTGLLFTK